MHAGEGPYGRVDALVGFQTPSDQDYRAIGAEGLGGQEGLDIRSERHDGQPRFYERIPLQKEPRLRCGNAGHLGGAPEQERGQRVVDDVHGGSDPGASGGKKMRGEHQRHLRYRSGHHRGHGMEAVRVDDVEQPSVSP
jgi:hypothetical protein